MNAKKQALMNLKKFAKGMTATMYKKKKLSPAAKEVEEVEAESDEPDELCEPEEFGDADDKAPSKEVQIIVSSMGRSPAKQMQSEMEDLTSKKLRGRPKKVK